jgi:hypothetical protein
MRSAVRLRRQFQKSHNYYPGVAILRGDRVTGNVSEFRGAKRQHFALEHDPEKWMPVFGKDHAQSKS